MTLKLVGSSSGHTSIDAPAAAGSNTLVLPPNNGTAGQVLTTDGNGNLTWTDNTPIWLAKLSSNYGHGATNSWVTAQLATEIIDTDNAFNTSNYTFTVPSGKGGKYVLYYNQEVQDNPDDGENIQGRINKNGSAINLSYTISFSPGSNKTTNVGKSWVETLSAGDTLTMSLYHHEGGTVTYSAGQTYFGGYKLIGG